MEAKTVLSGLVSVPVGTGFGVVEKSEQKPKLPICFVVAHKSGHKYQVWYFENLNLLVKVSNSYDQTMYHQNSYHPPVDSFKALSKQVFNKILSSDVFEVI